MRIIAIGAHLDDIELACGGTLAKAVKAGHTVKMYVLSDSSYDNYDGTVMRSVSTAKEEGVNAAKELGVNDLEIGDFKTKYIKYEADLVEQIDRVISGFKPDLIFTHWPFDTHQDHEAVSKASIAAARHCQNILFYEPIAPSGRSYIPFRQQYFVDISNEIEDKNQSLLAHESQMTKYEGWSDAAIARAKFHGFQCNCKFAECFEILRLKDSLI